MKQYEFEVRSNRLGTRYTVMVTSQTVQKALQAMRDAYGLEFEITEQPVAVHKPHRFFCEIDATR